MKHHMRVVWGSFALLVALLIAIPAMAAPVFKTTDRSGKPVALTLLKTQCSNAAVLKHLLGNIRPEYLDKFKDSRLLWEGKVWASCWLLYNGIVYSFDEEGSSLQPIPMEAFRDDSV